jgi:hypothetical protein
MQIKLHLSNRTKNKVLKIVKLQGLEPGFSASEADAITTKPSHRGMAGNHWGRKLCATQHKTDLLSVIG